MTIMMVTLKFTIPNKSSSSTPTPSDVSIVELTSAKHASRVFSSVFSDAIGNISFS